MTNATVHFIDKSTEFTSRIAVFADTMMALMAASIESQIKTSGRVPFKKGALRSSIKSSKVSVGKYQVTAGTGTTAAAYAAAQEAGTTRGHVMQNYTTPGTGAGWFQDGVDTVKQRTAEYAQTAQNAAGIGSL
jgi:hypothetical protein